MSVFAWPDGWRRVAHVEPAVRCRPLAPVYAARTLTAEDMAAVYGPGHGERRACAAGHDLVTWHGDAPCFTCGAPGLLRDGAA